MSSESDGVDTAPSEQSAAELVKRRASELRTDKSFDPRKEKELNDLYNQYVPPHSLEETSHLLDVAERDAYIDPFPPIGSQKLAGGAIKKGVRVAIGWYIQYVAQQISTFGSGVAQALRSIHKDVEELKKSAGKNDLEKLLDPLNLESIDKDLWSTVSSKFDISSCNRVVISDAVDSSFLINSAEKFLVVDSRSRICSELDSSIDSRKSQLLPFLRGIEDQSLDGLILHGRIDFMSTSQKIELIEECARVLRNDSPLIVVARSARHSFSDVDPKIAYEITGAKLWSVDTWTHVIGHSFNNFEELNTEKEGLLVFVAENQMKS